MLTPKIDPPAAALFVMSELKKNRFNAYLVGGCVRDCLLQKEPADWDICTNALPEEVKQVFPHTLDVGIVHGIVAVRTKTPMMQFDVATLRKDGVYKDNRHPESVSFVNDVKLDLARRDFSVNAIAWSPDDGLIDPFDGASDIKARVIRCVGNPNTRFKEDALRIMRAIRFSAQLNFTIDPQTTAALCSTAPLLKSVSAERIREELDKILVSHNPSFINLLNELNILHVILPEVEACFLTEQNNPHHFENVGAHTCRVLQNCHELVFGNVKEQSVAPLEPILNVCRENSAEYKLLCLSALYHDVGKPSAHFTDENGVDHFHIHPSAGAIILRSVMRRLKYPVNTIKEVSTAVENHDFNIPQTDTQMRRLCKKVGIAALPRLLCLQYADTMAHVPSMPVIQSRLQAIEKAVPLWQRIVSENPCLSVNDLAINGNDLMKLGVYGQDIQKAKEHLLNIVLREPEKNTYETLINEFQKML